MPACSGHGSRSGWPAGPATAAGPRRLARHDLEGLALVGGDAWTAADVEAALAAAGRQPGELDIVLTGGELSDPAALADAGATWCVVERGPGTTLTEAQRLAASRP